MRQSFHSKFLQHKKNMCTQPDNTALTCIYLLYFLLLSITERISISVLYLDVLTLFPKVVNHFLKHKSFKKQETKAGQQLGGMLTEIHRERQMERMGKCHRRKTHQIGRMPKVVY